MRVIMKCQKSIYLRIVESLLSIFILILCVKLKKLCVFNKKWMMDENVYKQTFDSIFYIVCQLNGNYRLFKWFYWLYFVLNITKKMYVYHLLFRSKNTDFSCLNNCNTFSKDNTMIFKTFRNQWKKVLSICYI